MPITSKDMLADHEDTREFSGVVVRKGTLGAVLANVEIFESPTTTAEEKADALQGVRDLAPALIAIGFYKHLVWKNPEIQRVLDEVAGTI